MALKLPAHLLHTLLSTERPPDVYGDVSSPPPTPTHLGRENKQKEYSDRGKGGTPERM